MLHYSRKKTAQHIAYVPQTGKSVPISVYDTVLLGRMPYIRGFGGAKDKTLVDEILEKLSITSCRLCAYFERRRHHHIRHTGKNNEKRAARFGLRH